MSVLEVVNYGNPILRKKCQPVSDFSRLPKFVEDMVRDIAVHFNNDDRVTEYVVESENFESIHNHSAYAQIHKVKD